MNDGIGSSLTTIVVTFIVIAGIAFFIILSTAGNLDSSILTNIQEETNAFVKECANTEEMTANKLENYISKIQNYGIRFETEITVWKLQEGVSKKSTQVNNRLSPSSPYEISKYTVDDVIKKGKLTFNPDDMVGVKIYNVSPSNQQSYSGQNNSDLQTMTAEATETVR